MSLFGAEFGFLHPLLLAGLPLVAAGLFYAYLKRGRGQRVLVASTLLLERLQRTSNARKKFIPPIRFWIELLLLCALVLAASGLYQRNAGSRVAVLIDNSFSMFAADLSGSPAHSRIEAARAEAARYIGSLSSAARVSVFVTSPGLHSLSPDPESPGAARGRLSGILPVYASDSLESSLGRLAGDERFDRIEAFTDHPAASADPGTATDSRVHLSVVSAPTPGAAGGNLAVSGMRLTRNALGSAGAGAEVSVANYGDQPARTRVTLASLGAGKEWTKIRDQSLEVPAHGSASLTFEGLPAELSTARASIAPEVGGARVDAIAEDDTAWIALTSEGERLLLVSEFAPAELNLGELRGVRFDYLAPAQYSAEAVRKIAPRAVIFHRVAPQKLPEVNSLLVLPPEDNPIIKRLPEAAAPKVTRWDASHALLSYVNLAVLALPKAAPLAPPGWGEVVLSTSAGPALVAGELGGHRYAAFGFDLFPYEGKKAPVVSILTLNCVKWLAELSVHEGFRPVYSSVRLDQEISAVQRESGGRLRPIENSAEITLDVPGLYWATRGGGEQPIAVNFFNAEESDAFRRAPVRMPPLAARQAAVRSDDGLTRALAWWALMFLALDLLWSICRPLLKRGARA